MGTCCTAKRSNKYVASSPPQLLARRIPYIHIYLKLLCSPNNTPFKDLVLPEEVEVLSLIFEDLASRTAAHKITRQIFDVFFHSSGLWCQEIFDQFDVKHRGTISFEEFRTGMEHLVKSDPAERVHALFHFYNIDRTKGISYQELLKMLFSYPKDDLKKLIGDEQFIASMNPEERYYHFGKALQLDERREVVEQESCEESSTELDQRRKDKINSSDALKDKIEISYSGITNNNHNNKNKNQDNNQVSNPTSIGSMQCIPGLRTRNKSGSRVISKLPNVAPAGSRRRSGSISYSETASFSKKFKVTSNLSLVVKKYANFIFKEFNLDREKDQISEQQFLTLLEKHALIWTIYFEGFHTYIWEINDRGVPLSLIERPFIEGECLIQDSKAISSTKKFIRLIKTTLLVYTGPSERIPEDIKNLEGLQIEEYIQQQPGAYGFSVKHRDGIYQEKTFLFDDKKNQEHWLRYLSPYKQYSVYDTYQFMDRIGTGNFSSVYKAEQKSTNTFWAVKVIEKFSLSAEDKLLIKRECAILQLCHHPYIIRFKERIDSKTHMFIVTELMSEGGLYEYIKRKGFLQEYEASIVAEQLIDTLVYLNSLGLIHRDLKPENILIRLNKDQTVIERVKLIDFGFAVYREGLKDLSNEEKFAGTPGYLAPEVLALDDYDETIDNFSLGVIIYFMLSGMLPFHSGLDEEVIKMTLRCNFTFNNPHWKNISKNGRDLVSRLLTFKQTRIGLEEALKHPWITEREDLKAFIGTNPKRPKKNNSSQ